ncbi:hypothetical protein MRB53_036857 [Persea americana]|nr:hypothetical protein MRB53_036857 [Persea americana]
MCGAIHQDVLCSLCNHTERTFGRYKCPRVALSRRREHCSGAGTLELPITTEYRVCRFCEETEKKRKKADAKAREAQGVAAEAPRGAILVQDIIRDLRRAHQQTDAKVAELGGLFFGMRVQSPATQHVPRPSLQSLHTLLEGRLRTKHNASCNVSGVKMLW